MTGRAITRPGGRGHRSPSPRPAPARRARPGGPAPPAAVRRAGWAAGIALAAVLLFVAYLRQSRLVPAGSDGGSIALQAWDMLHGNLLLQHWTVSDVSFWPTELVQYAAIEAVRGLGPDVVHIAGAMTYTLVLLLAAWLARGRATGREGLVRALVAAVIMLAPAPDAGPTLLMSPDHFGSTVPVLLAWLAVDRLPARWYRPLAVALLLTWGQVADGLILVTGVAPMVIVCAVACLRAAAAPRAGQQPALGGDLAGGRRDRVRRAGAGGREPHHARRGIRAAAGRHGVRRPGHAAAPSQAHRRGAAVPVRGRFPGRPPAPTCSSPPCT